jgi:hypothetical protein
MDPEACEPAPAVLMVCGHRTDLLNLNTLSISNLLASGPYKQSARRF